MPTGLGELRGQGPGRAPHRRQTRAPELRHLRAAHQVCQNLLFAI